MSCSSSKANAPTTRPKNNSVSVTDPSQAKGPLYTQSSVMQDFLSLVLWNSTGSPFLGLPAYFTKPKEDAVVPVAKETTNMQGGPFGLESYTMV